ncbi:coiled-coil domain-containing protein 62 isoform X2 [Salminus brasiliensis]
MPSNHVSSLSYVHTSKSPALKMEISTIEKQRMELQLLIAELKDRDQELNTMAAAHHRQLQAWEQDRQRVLTLEQRCGRLEDELQKRNEVIRAISKRLKVVEAQEKDSYRELSTAQQRVQELSQSQQHSSQQRHTLEEKTQSLNSTIMTLSSQVGQLQVHEEELTSMLKLKDKDLMEATSHILGLTNRLQESDASLKQSQARESKLLRETEEYKRRFREARHNNVQLKDDLQEKTIENNSQREELIRLKQENQLLRKELALAGEGESWKDELLGLARSKQERTESELLCLRQVCEKQQNDLQLLKLNLESAREALRRHECQRSRESPIDVTCLFVDCPISSPRSRRSPVPVEDAFNVTASGSQEEYTSSTSRLQRLLAESQQMVASLERSSGKSLSPTPSPTSNSVCSLRANHNNSNSHNHSQSCRNSLGENQRIRVDDSQVQSNLQLSGTKDCGQ